MTVNIRTEQINVSLPGKSMKAFLARPDSKEGGKEVPGIILIHEIWRLNENIVDIAQRVAREGYAVLAPDLFSGTGLLENLSPDLQKRIADPATKDEAQKEMRTIFAPMKNPEFAKDMMQKLAACYRYLDAHSTNVGKIGVIGFCFGGTYSLALAVYSPALKACISFYGRSPTSEAVAHINCPILAFYGEQDEELIQQLPELQDAMKKNKKDFTHKVYKNTGHAFFNDKNPARYNKSAAEDAWKLTLNFLRAKLH